MTDQTPEQACEPDYAEPQRQVQRWLGRCMLSLQQTERMLKALLHDSDVAILRQPDSTALQVRRAFDSEQMHQMTLGQAVKAVIEHCISTDDVRAPSIEPSDERALSMAWRFQIVVADAQDGALLRDRMAEVVSLRNDMVHHLIERFQLNDLKGCEEALSYLQQAYEKVESFRQLIWQHGQGIVHAHEKWAELLRGEAFRELLTNGRCPLPRGTIPSAVYAALQQCAKQPDGSVLLADIRQFMADQAPAERPETYGYASWQHLLHESRVASIERKDANGARVPARVRVKQD